MSIGAFGNPRPVALRANPVEHFYRGGDRIADWRGFPPLGERYPEDWAGSTVTLRGDPRGRSTTIDGALLSRLVSTDPFAWLGLVPPTPGDIGLLVKILDAGERLPVHTHPTRSQARELLGEPYGKTEAWIVLACEPGARFHLGWREPVEADWLADALAREDSQALLDAMNVVEAQPGLGVLVPAGVPHAIGEGIFLAEVQEPTDASVLVERWITPVAAEDAMLGLDPASALATVDLAAHDAGALVQQPGATGSALPAAAEPYFRVIRRRSGDELGDGFRVLVVTSGSGAVRGGDTVTLVSPGSVVAVPASVAAELDGDDDLAVLEMRAGAGWPTTLDEVR